jgi:hypothetical protein
MGFTSKRLLNQGLVYVPNIWNPNPEPQVTLTEFKDYQTLLDVNPDLPRVFLEPKTKKFNPDTIWLHDFHHPLDCIYILGSAHYNPTLKHKRDIDTIVSIKTMQDGGVLWSNQCMLLVLYDRMIKSWQSQQ